MSPKPWRDDVRAVRPMLATLGDHPLTDAAFVYEPKYDGIRALVEVGPGARAPVRIWSRLGNEKTAQFPDLVDALRALARTLRRAVVLDGEIVALDPTGEPTGFQQLQGRIHLTTAAPSSETAALVAFDLLRDGEDDLRELPLTDRRARLEAILRGRTSSAVRLSEQARGHGEPLWERALSRGWEGLIAKRAASCYRSGRRSPEWVKLKLVAEQEFVIGGWTEPRGARSHFGALLLGVYDGDALEYVGHTGAGFDGRELQRVAALLKTREIAESPFRVRPRPNERPHWVRPELVAQVKFTEWTADSKLRHPTYLGLRDDVAPRAVTREPVAARQKAGARGEGPGAGKAHPARRRSERSATRTSARTPATATRSRKARGTASRGAAVPAPELQPLVDRLIELEESGRDGALVLPGGDRLDVTNLRKVFWPDAKLTKGDLLRHYVRVAPFILPVVADRPLVMKRLPNGIDGKAFYQQRAPSPAPKGVRVETVEGDTDVPSRLIGGNLKTLLYMAQIAAISQDPWFSRVQSPGVCDHVAIDLDPMPGVSFATVLDVARWVRDELATLKAEGFPKTSGADGLHVFIPLPPGTPYEAGVLYAQIVATLVASKHPKVATVERAVRARGKTVYVDYLQNIQGKTLACAYSARGSEYAGVSTPLSWDEIDEGVDRRDFTIETLAARLGTVGDLWEPLRRSKGAPLRAVERYLDQGPGARGQGPGRAPRA
jgi:bifunctional non-homologous end joining protein LigD